MPRLLVTMVLVACMAGMVCCRPVAGRRRLQTANSTKPTPTEPPSSPSPGPERIEVEVEGKTLWTIPAKSTTDGAFVSLTDLKSEMEKFKLADGTGGGSGGGGGSGDVSGAAVLEGEASPSPTNPFLDINNPSGALDPTLTSEDAAAAAAAISEGTTTSPSPSPSPTPELPPSPSPEPLPSPSPPPPPVFGGKCPDAQAALDYGNAVRAQYNAGPLSWNNDLAARAQAWADTCTISHSPGAVGENLMWGPQLSGCYESVIGWANEAPLYSAGEDWTPPAGHFTQLVWKGTSQVGCGMAYCPGQQFVVCNYNAPGNVIGQFTANIG